MLEILTSDALSPVRHGFFTRKGGASRGVLAGLNCGYGSADDREAVRTNRDRAARALGVAPANLVTVRQVHGADVVEITTVPPGVVEADAMVTRMPGLALGVLTADCQPVLMADSAAGVIAAAHAGWRGARDGILENTIDAMVALGADRQRIVAAIGPTISQAAYQVGHDYMQDFLDDDAENARFFAGDPGHRPHFDLPGYGLARLRAAGIAAAEWIGHCTCADAERFYSYRRSALRGDADYGRLLSAIRL